ncbi:MAG: FG-GAP repeat domain-containing protein [Blastocatellia bacterium]
MLRMLAPILFVALISTLQSQSSRPAFVPAPGSPVPVGEGSGRLILVDVNGDRRLDLVTSHLMNKFVSVRLGDGAGRFAAAPGSPIALKYEPGDIKLADLNGDNIPDLAVTHSERDSVDILFGNGQGGFRPAAGSPYSVSADGDFYTRSLDLIDLNEDGKPDIVTANRRRNVFATLLGDGRGRFSAGPTITIPTEEGRLSFVHGEMFGDLDGDRHLDLVIVSRGEDLAPQPGRLRVFRGDGKGSFKERSIATSPLPEAPRFVRLADLNGDKRLDIVTSHNGDQLSVLLNLGNDKFGPAPGSPYNLDGTPFAVAVADVNQDQRNDLAAAAVDGIVVLLGGRDGFAAANGSPFRAGPGAYHLTVGDVDNDGKPDIAASSFEGNAVTLLLGR